MTTFDSIVNAARTLNAAERLELARLLLNEACADNRDGEAAVGERGLASLTESTRAEDWSEFYPSEIRL